MFIKASRKSSKLRLLLEGPSGCGKTYSALLLAKGFGGKIAVLDTEKGSASLYAGEFEFDVSELSPPYEPEKYIKAIQYVSSNDYNVLIIDSLTHEWSGEGGCLDIQSKLGGSYTDWAKVTPRHNKFIEAILGANCHIIATARTKSDYEMGEAGGKQKISKVGTKTEQREGLEFEFTTVLRLNQQHMYEASKDRTHLFDGKQSILRIEDAQMLLNWLDHGVDESKEYSERLLECQSIEELKNAWLSTPAHLQTKLEKVKDSRKNALVKPKPVEEQEDMPMALSPLQKALLDEQQKKDNK